MALDERLDLGELDLVVRADGLGSKIAGQAGTAAGALVGTMIDNAIDILAHRAAVTFMTGLGATGLRLVPALLAVG